MPLWGNTSTDANDKPLFLNANGDYYVASNCEGVTVSDADSSNGVLTSGWVYPHHVPGVVSGITVLTGGSGYSNGTYNFSGGGGNTANATIVTDANGAITSANVTNGGTGYYSTPTFAPSGGANATFKISITGRIRYETLVAMPSMTS